MNKKRVITAIIGIPMVGLIFTLGNQYIVDIFISIVAILAMKEYFRAISSKAKPIKWIGYLSCIFIAFIHIFLEKIQIEVQKDIFVIVLPIIMLVSFLQIILSNMKTNFNDMIYTIFGIIYIIGNLIFISLIRNLEEGKILIWYFIIASWGTDIFAYIIGRRFGKHKFSKVSPNKSIEGCIAGIIGAEILSIIFTFAITKFGYNYSYLIVSIITIILSIISQIGDFSASCIKRYFNLKDFGKLIPGHGGTLDRIDSLMFIAPFAYMLLKSI